MHVCTTHDNPGVCLSSNQVGKVVALLSQGKQCTHFFEQGAQDFLVGLSLHSRIALDCVMVTVCMKGTLTHVMSH